MTKPEPTKATPGSNEKVEVMRRRAENDEEIFSEDDTEEKHNVITERSTSHRMNIPEGR